MELIIKMDKTAIIVSAVAGSLGLLGAILGFIAQGKNPSDTSVGLGIAAAILLLGGQTTVSVAGGCFGCCKTSRAVVTSENKRIIGIVCGVFSWVLATVGLVLFFLVGLLDAGTYAGGGVLTLLATALGVTAFILLRGKPAADAGAPNGISFVKLRGQPDAEAVSAAGAPNGTTGEQQLPAGIPMGQPQFPPAAAKTSEPPTTAVPEIVVRPPQFPSTVSHAQGHGSHAPNMQFPPPPQVHPWNTAPPAGSDDTAALATTHGDKDGGVRDAHCA